MNRWRTVPAGVVPLPNGRPSRALLRVVRSYRAADEVGRRAIELALEEVARDGEHWAANRRALRAGSTPMMRRDHLIEWLREFQDLACAEPGRPPAPTAADNQIERVAPE